MEWIWQKSHSNTPDLNIPPCTIVIDIFITRYIANAKLLYFFNCKEFFSRTKRKHKFTFFRAALYLQRLAELNNLMFHQKTLRKMRWIGFRIIVVKKSVTIWPKLRPFRPLSSHFVTQSDPKFELHFFFFFFLSSS